jgi:hypothetical protein
MPTTYFNPTEAMFDEAFIYNVLNDVAMTVNDHYWHTYADAVDNCDVHEYTDNYFESLVDDSLIVRVTGLDFQDQPFDYKATLTIESVEFSDYQIDLGPNLVK